MTSHLLLWITGKGLPFFSTTIPGIVKTDENKKTTGMIAKNVRGDNVLLLMWFKFMFLLSTNSHLIQLFVSFAFQFISDWCQQSFFVHKQLGVYGK